MRLADFILQNIEPILAEWEGFARSVWPVPEMDVVALRDHAADILRATALDMKSSQTGVQQSDKSKGDGVTGKASSRVDVASDVHAVGRVRSGFHLMALVAEYRAVRASVIRLWRESRPLADAHDLDDLTRFNESIDQSLTEAIRSYTNRVDQSRQMFLGILGHDLRNPLSAMMMSAQVLAMKGNLDPDLKSIATRISIIGSGMAQMISDLLDFTSTRLGAEMPLSRSPMDLGKLGGEVVAEIRAGHPTRSIDFEATGNLKIDGDAARLRQVISNLLGNAVQHGGAQGPVQVRAQPDGDGVMLSVHNAGKPIPRDAIATIFDPLVRAMSDDERRDRRAGSIGLGLYIVREVVTAHGGSVDVESSEADGTAFTIHLPRRARVRVEPNANMPVPVIPSA